MADELSFDYVVTGDKDVTSAAERIGKVSAESALKIEAANVRLEKATRAVAKAEDKYGKSSLEARAAAVSLAQAQGKLDKAMASTADTVDDAGGRFEKFGGTLETVGATAGLAAGVAVTSAFAGAVDFEAANAKLEAQLGLSASESKKFGAIAGDLYADAYGDSIESVNEAIKEVQQQKLIDPGATNAAIESVTGKVISLSDAFGQDLAGTTRAAGQLMRTGLAKDADEALDLITVGLQKIPGAGDDLLDTINEYSTQFRSLGISGPEAINFIAQAMQGGARDTDIAADALKEFNLRARDVNDTKAQGALEELGFAAHETAQRLAGGGDSAAAATKEILTRLREVQDPTERSALAVALLGTQAEDLQDALFAVDPSKLTTGLGDIEGAAARVDAALGNTSSATLTSFKRSVEQNFTDAAASVIDFGSANSGIVGPLTGVAAAAGGVVVAVNLGKKAVDASKRAYDTATGAIDSFGSAAGKAKGNVAALGKATAVIAGYVVAMQALGAVAPKIEDSAAGVGEMALALNQLGSGKAQEIAGLGKNFGDLGAQLEGLANPNAMQRIDDFTGSLFNLVSFGAVGSSKGGDARRLFLADLETLDQSLTAMVSGGKTEEAAGLFQQLNEKAIAGGAGVDQLAKHLPQYTDAVAQAGAKSGEAVTPVSDLAKGIGEQKNAAALAAQELEQLVEQTNNYTNAALSANDAARGYEAAIDDATEAAKTNGETLDITTEKGRANSAALDGIASAGVKYAEQIVANGGTEAQYQRQLGLTRDALIKAGTQMGLGKTAAKTYADQILKIPASRSTTITANTSQALGQVAYLKGRIQALDGTTITVYARQVLADSDVRFRAAGGPVEKGQPYIVGEHRPELFVPESNGKILPFVPRAQAVQGAGGGGVTTLVLQSSGSRLDDLLVEVIRRAVRTRGGGNVQVALGRAS